MTDSPASPLARMGGIGDIPVFSEVPSAMKSLFDVEARSSIHRRIGSLGADRPALWGGTVTLPPCTR